MRRLRGRAVLSVLFAILALNAWVQVLLVPLGRSDDPGALTVLQALVGTTGAAAAWGSWRGARWAPASAVLYGLVTATMLVALAPLLDLEPDAQGGLWTGAAAVLLFALWAGWYLRRAIGLSTPQS
jgi:hypothetical protein